MKPKSGIRKLGSQNIILRSAKPSDSSGSSNETRCMVIDYGLTTKDITQIQRTVPDISLVVPSRFISDMVWNFGSQDRCASWVPAGSIPVCNRKMVLGRFFHRFRAKDRVSVCVLNQAMAAKLFPLNTPTGKAARVRGN